MPRSVEEGGGAGGGGGWQVKTVSVWVGEGGVEERRRTWQPTREEGPAAACLPLGKKRRTRGTFPPSP